MVTLLPYTFIILLPSVTLHSHSCNMQSLYLIGIGMKPIRFLSFPLISRKTHHPYHTTCKQKQGHKLCTPSLPFFIHTHTLPLLAPTHIHGHKHTHRYACTPTRHQTWTGMELGTRRVPLPYGDCQVRCSQLARYRYYRCHHRHRHGQAT